MVRRFVGRPVAMNNKVIARNGNNQAVKTLDERFALMNAAMQRLGLSCEALAKRGLANRNTGGGLSSQGRLIVALDLTGSRAESLKQARKATAQMFTGIKAVGKVGVKLAYYRGW